MRQQQYVGRFRRHGRQSRHSRSLRKVIFGVATFALDGLSGSSFEAQRIGFLGGQVPGRQTVPGAELWGVIQALGRVDEKTIIQFTIDVRYVTKGATHTGSSRARELEYGPNGDLFD